MHDDKSSTFSKVILILFAAVSQKADDLSARVVNSAERGNMGLNLRLEIRRCREVTAAQERCTELFRMEETFYILQELLRCGTLNAEEEVRCNLVKICIHVN